MHNDNDQWAKIAESATNIKIRRQRSTSSAEERDITVPPAKPIGPPKK